LNPRLLGSRFSWELVMERLRSHWHPQANMVSHAHGQGYTDLNWLIPELVDRIA
jgi:hypothetical protein